MTSERKPLALYRFVLHAVALTLAVAAAGPGTVLAGEQQPAAVLAVVSGAVTIHRGDADVEGTFGAALQAGDVVVTGDGGQAAILFDSGQIIELGGGSKMSIGSLPSKDPGPVVAQMTDALSGSLVRFTSNAAEEPGLSALPDLRSGGASGLPEPIYPRNTLVPAQGVVFTWNPVEDALEYRITVTGDGPAAGTHSVSEPRWAVPDPGLEPGGQYTWRVEAVTPDGPLTSQEVVVKAATPEQTKELAGITQQLGPLMSSQNRVREDTAAYLLGSYCRSAGFYGDAISHLESLVARNPNSKELYQELGSLYQAVGNNDKAADAYRRALSKQGS
jgi:hypothetical protein